MRKKMVYLVIIAVISGALNSLVFVNPYENNITAGVVIMQLSGSRGNFSLGYSMNELLGFILCLMPNLIMIFMLGVFIYEHFCIGSIYVFSRCTKRIKWYNKLIIQLLFYILFFHITYLTTVLLITAIRFDISFAIADWNIILYHIAIFSMWNFFWILVMNLLSLKMGSSRGGLYTIGTQVLLTSLLQIMNLLEKTEKEIGKMWIRMNPIAVLVVDWHKWDNMGKENRERTFLNFHTSLVIMICSAIIIYLCGLYIIKRKEIIVESREWGE